MAKKMKLDSLKQLPQRDEVWAMINRAAPAWVDGPLGTPLRPHLVAVFEGSTGMVLCFDMLEAPGVSAAEALDTLRRAMLAEALGGEFTDESPSIPRQPYRPSQLLVEGEQLAKALEPEMKALGIDCKGVGHIPDMDDFMRLMAEHLSGESATGLARIAGMSAFTVQEFYTAAADYYRAAPWKWLSNLHLIEFRFSADDHPRFACIMGNGREEFGLSIYDTLQQFQALTSTQSPKDTQRLTRKQTISSVTFGAPWEGTPFDDLDDIQQYKYPIAGENAYPSFLKLVPPGTRVDPAFEDVSRYSAVMRTLPEFVTQHIDAAGKLPRPAEATLTLPEIYNGHTVTFRFPVIKEEIVRTPDMEERGLVDEASLARWLVPELKARVPFGVRLSDQAAENLRGSSFKIKPGQQLSCVDVFSPESMLSSPEDSGAPGRMLGENTGELDGIMCALKVGREALLVSLTHVDADDPALPLRREINAYQFQRYCNQADRQEDEDLDLGPEALDEILNELTFALRPGPGRRKPGRRK